MSSSRYSFRRNVRQHTEENNNNEVGNNNDNNGPPPQPQLVVPPAGDNNNNNQAAINDELAAAGAADAAGAAAPVDPFAASVAQLNADRPIVSLLQDARNGNGQSLRNGEVVLGYCFKPLLLRLQMGLWDVI